MSTIQRLGPSAALRTECGGHVTPYPSGDGVKLWRRLIQRLAEGTLAGAQGSQPLGLHRRHSCGQGEGVRGLLKVH